MRLTLAALLAAVLAAGATPAFACDFFRCADEALADDLYPPGEKPLPPTIQELVRDREDAGLSLVGFYNDPALALARRAYYEPVAYGAPPPPAYDPTPVEGPAWGERHWDRRHPHVVMSPYGRRMAHHRHSRFD